MKSGTLPHASRGIAILNSAMKPTIASSENLRIYAEKRDFSATPSHRRSSTGKRKGPLLFVVHQHAASQLHYDLRLELDGVLKSWAVTKGPSLDPADKRGRARD
jgi:bifunctional non-homologous end joining protein LigD